MHHDNDIQPHPCCETTGGTELTERKQQGGNRGRQEQLPKPHNSVRDSVCHEALNPSFLGRNEDCNIATSLTPRRCVLPCWAWWAWTWGAWPWPALPMGHARVCACYCSSPASQHPTAHTHAYWWHGFPPKIRFLLILITKSCFTRKVLWHLGSPGTIICQKINGILGFAFQMDNVSVFTLPPEFPFCCSLFTAVLSKVLAGWSAADNQNRERKVSEFQLVSKCLFTSYRADALSEYINMLLLKL